MEYNPTSPLIKELGDFEKYFDLERHSMALAGYADRHDKLFLRQRALLLLDQILKKERDLFISYLALSYFDRFLSKEALGVQDLEYAVICCIFLASKMRDNAFSVHLFVTKWRNLNINQGLILEMESRILYALEWRLRSVTALCFVGYFLRMLPDDLRPSRNAVNEIIIQTQSEMKLTEFKPSVIAASATFIASSVQFPVRLEECFSYFKSCIHVNETDLNKCIKIMMGSCKMKTFLKATTQAAKESSSSSKEPVVESTETMEVIGRRPGKEQVVESTETMEVIGRRPGKEPMGQSSETTEVTSQISLNVPLFESLEMNEAIRSEWEDLMEEARRWPVNAPLQRNPEMMNFELKWLTEDEESMARDYIRNLSLSYFSGNVAGAGAGASNAGDIDRHDADNDRRVRAERNETDRHRADSDVGTGSERINDTDMHNTGRAKHDHASLHECCKLQ